MENKELILISPLGGLIVIIKRRHDFTFTCFLLLKFLSLTYKCFTDKSESLN